MSKIIRLYRHGETTWNEQGRLQGWLNSALTTHGIEQVKPSEWQADIVLSSDLGRAKQTASSLFPKNEIKVDPRLREIYLGDWQGRYISELAHHEDYQLYIKHPEKFTAFTQEPFEQVTSRFEKVIEEALELPGEHIAIVSHGVAIACYLTKYKGQDACQLWDNLLGSGQFFELELVVEVV